MDENPFQSPTTTTSRTQDLRRGRHAQMRLFKGILLSWVVALGVWFAVGAVTLVVTGDQGKAMLASILGFCLFCVGATAGTLSVIRHTRP